MLRESNFAAFKCYSPCQLLSRCADEQRQDTAGLSVVKIELSLPKKLKSYINESKVPNSQHACRHMHTHTFICTQAHTRTYLGYM